MLGQSLPLQGNLKGRPSGQMVPANAWGLVLIFSDQGWLDTSSKAPHWLTKSVTESKLPLLATREANKSKGLGIEARKMTLFGKPANQEDGRRWHLVRAWMPGFLWIRDCGSEGGKKDHLILANIC